MLEKKNHNDEEKREVSVEKSEYESLKSEEQIKKSTSSAEKMSGENTESEGEKTVGSTNCTEKNAEERAVSEQKKLEESVSSEERTVGESAASEAKKLEGSAASEGEKVEDSTGIEGKKFDFVSESAKLKKVQLAKNQKILLGMGVFAVLVLAVYVVIALLFTNRFFDGTYINGQNFSRAETETVVYFIESKADVYSLAVIGVGGLNEEIKGREISLTITEDGQVEELLGWQNRWAWPSMLFNSNYYEILLIVDYCKALLAEQIDGIVSLENETTVEPVNAKPAFNGELFEVQEEVLGTLINPEILTPYVKEYLSALGESLNLYEKGVYIRPEISSDNPELIAAVDRLNHYVGASITYELNPKLVTVNSEQIVDWVSWDENFNVLFYEYRARAFMSEFIETYSTRGTTRTFTNPLGHEASVESNFWGWCLDEETEVEEFISNIRNGETARREPAYFVSGSFQENGEWGDTFIQVDLTQQHMWYFVDGELVLESPVVTGLPGRSPTPPGIFDIQVMLSPTVLVGPRNPETGEPLWRSPVSYWMQITWSGIGLHDATWQPYFGGQRFSYGGSRGCINMPLDKAGELYEMVDIGTVTIVHF